MPLFAVTVTCSINKRIEVEADNIDSAIVQAEELAWEPSEDDVYDHCEYVDSEELEDSDDC